MIVVGLFLWLIICPAAFASCQVDREKKIMSEIIEKLRNLGEQRPSRCMSEAEHMTKIEYPRYPKESMSAVEVLELSWRSAAELFKKDTSTTGWNTSQLRQLQHLLGQQSDCYRPSFPDVSSGEHVEQWNRFWARLGDFLSEKKFSACAWESVRPVVQRIIRKLCKSIRSPREQLRKKRNVC